MDGSNCLERAKKTDERVKAIELAFHLQVQVSLKVYITLSLSFRLYFISCAKGLWAS